MLQLYTPVLRDCETHAVTTHISCRPVYQSESQPDFGCVQNSSIDGRPLKAAELRTTLVTQDKYAGVLPICTARRLLEMLHSLAKLDSHGLKACMTAVNVGANRWLAQTGLRTSFSDSQGSSCVFSDRRVDTSTQSFVGRDGHDDVGLHISSCVTRKERCQFDSIYSSKDNTANIQLSCGCTRADISFVSGAKHACKSCTYLDGLQAGAQMARSSPVTVLYALEPCASWKRQPSSWPW